MFIISLYLLSIKIHYSELFVNTEGPFSNQLFLSCLYPFPLFLSHWKLSSSYLRNVKSSKKVNWDYHLCNDLFHILFMFDKVLIAFSHCAAYISQVQSFHFTCDTITFQFFPGLIMTSSDKRRGSQLPHARCAQKNTVGFESGAALLPVTKGKKHLKDTNDTLLMFPGSFYCRIQRYATSSEPMKLN